MDDESQVQRRDPPNGSGYHILIPGPGPYPHESAEIHGPFRDLREAAQAQARLAAPSMAEIAEE